MSNGMSYRIERDIERMRESREMADAHYKLVEILKYDSKKVFLTRFGKVISEKFYNYRKHSRAVQLSDFEVKALREILLRRVHELEQEAKEIERRLDGVKYE